jgi:hypothetical protein
MVDDTGTSIPKATVKVWERLATIGISGVATLGLLGATSYFVAKGIDVPQWYVVLVGGVVVGTGIIKAKAK